MSRLTDRLLNGKAYFVRGVGVGRFGDVAEKLSHYEDLEEQGRLIEIDLNELKRDELDRCTHRHCNKCDKYRLELQLYKDNDGRVKEMIGMDMAEASMRFAALTIAKNEGRLIELPCKDGATVYWITTHGILERYAAITEPIHSKIVELRPLGPDDEVYPYNVPTFFKEFGKTVFLTKAEAEAKLAELKEGGCDDM